MFFARKLVPEIKATEPVAAFLLDFSNRIVLGKQDCLAKIAAGNNASETEKSVLPINDTLKTLLDGMVLMESPCYHLLKQYEVFIDLLHSYPTDDLVRFFRPILTAADDFRAFVENNYTNRDSLDDMARKVNLSKSYFIRRFKEVFGITAHQWLVKQKRRELVRMIAGGEKNTKAMSEQLGFKNQTGLYQFCKTNFECSLTELIERVYQKETVPKIN